MTNYRKKLLWLYARKRGSGSGGISVSVSGTTPVTLANAIESAIRHMTQHGKVTQTGTPTTANPVDIVCNNGALKWDSENQRIYADGTPEVLTVSADDVEDQTATAENLLAVGPVSDEQDIITGKVIRRTEVFRYDGTQTVKPTYMSTTGGKDDGAIIVQPRGAEYAGDVVSFDAQEGENIDSLKVTLTPKQDLHGYESPWPAGGGKNKFDVSKMVNTSDITINNGVISVTGNSKNSGKKLSELADLTVGETYILTANTTGTDNIIYLYGTGANVSWAFGTSKTMTQEMLDALVFFYGGSNTTAQISNFMIRLASISDATFAPYSNLCPITGTDEVEVVQRGINLWDEEWEAGTISGGSPASANNAIRSKNFVPCVGGQTYYGVCGTYSNQYYLRIWWYDEEKAYISGDWVCGKTATSPDNARYFKISTNTSTYVYGNTYNHDISINYPATDTPYTPFDPQSTTLQIEWGALGKNLLDDTGTIVNSNYNISGFPVTLKTDTTYTFSVNGTTDWRYRLYLSMKDDPLNASIALTTGYIQTGNGNTFTTPSDMSGYVLCLAGSGNGAGNESIDAIKPQIELGSTKTTYEPFTKTIYGGTLDAVRGEIVVTMKSVDLGSLTWTNGSFAGVTGWYASAPSDIKPTTNSVAFNGIASQYAVIRFNAISTKYGTIALRDNGLLYVNHSDSPTGQLVYELASPITIPIAPQTLTALSHNTVWADAGPVDVLLGDELVEMVAKQPLRTAEGDNTVSVVSEVGEVELAVTYKGGSE